MLAPTIKTLVINQLRAGEKAVQKRNIDELRSTVAFLNGVYAANLSKPHEQAEVYLSMEKFQEKMFSDYERQFKILSERLYPLL